MASGPYIAASADLTFRVFGDGGIGDVAPYFVVAFHHLSCNRYELVARERDGSEHRYLCDSTSSSADLVAWWEGVVRDVAAA